MTFPKIGTDRNLEIGNFGIYHLAGFLGVLSTPVKHSATSTYVLSDPENHNGFWSGSHPKAG